MHFDCLLLLNISALTALTCLGTRLKCSSDYRNELCGFSHSFFLVGSLVGSLVGLVLVFWFWGFFFIFMDWDAQRSFWADWINLPSDSEMLTATLTALNDNIWSSFSFSLLINLIDNLIQNFPGTYLKGQVISTSKSAQYNGYHVV